MASFIAPGHLLEHAVGHWVFLDLQVQSWNGIWCGLHVYINNTSHQNPLADTGTDVSWQSGSWEPTHSTSCGEWPKPGSEELCTLLWGRGSNAKTLLFSGVRAIELMFQIQFQSIGQHCAQNEHWMKRKCELRLFENREIKWQSFASLGLFFHWHWKRGEALVGEHLRSHMTEMLQMLSSWKEGRWKITTSQGISLKKV